MGRREMKLDLIRPAHGDPVDHVVDRPVRRRGRRVEDRREGVADILGRQLAAVMKAHAPAQEKAIGQWIGLLPPFGQFGRDLKGGIDAHQRTVEQMGDPFRVGVGRKAGVEGDRIAFNGDDQPVIRRLGTTRHQDEQTDRQKPPRH